MSVNNLNEQLSWLLGSGCIIPTAPTYIRATPAQHISASLEASHCFPSNSRYEQTFGDPSKTIEVAAGHDTNQVKSRCNMTRVRTTTSPVKAYRDEKSDDGGDDDDEIRSYTSPSFEGGASKIRNAKQITTSARDGKETSPRRSPERHSTPRPAPANPLSTPILDLTMDEEARMEHIETERFERSRVELSVTPRLARGGRKRKSEEFEIDLCPSRSKPNSKREVSWGHGFAVIDDEIEDAPPPYSTVVLPSKPGPLIHENHSLGIGTSISTNYNVKIDNQMPKVPSSTDTAMDDALVSSHKAAQTDLDVLETLLTWTSDKLQLALRNRIIAFDNSLDVFVKATGEDEPDIEPLKKVLDMRRNEKKAMSTLIEELGSYNDLAAKHQNLTLAFKDAMRDETNEGHHDTAMKLKAATKNLREQSKQLVKWVHEANFDVYDKGELLPSEAGIANVAVCSTPSTQSWESPARSNLSRAPLSNELQATQFVQQTQAPAVATNQVIPSTRSVSKSINAMPAFNRQDSAAHPSPPDHSRWKKLPALDNDGFSNESENIFTTIMGTPSPRSSVVNEFEYEGDDDVLFEIADKIEQSHSKSREVFAERSANSAGRSSLRSPAKQALRPMRNASSVSVHEGLQHPWSTDVKDAMLNRFHLSGFRSNQLEAINITLSGNHVFVLMPTGGGKSLCYQLPAIIHSGKTQGVTIVVSPLLSLMEDQVSHLHRLGIQASLINGEIGAAARNKVMNDLRNPSLDSQLQILYVTPEMMTKNQGLLSTLRALHSRRKLARFVIDEAHCVSQWGHDFRPDYKALGEIIEEFDHVPIMALTATATENVKMDVMDNLNIKGCAVFSQSFNRPNLSYEVLSKTNLKATFDGIVNIINTRYRNKSGIVYCLSRKKCEEVAEQLRKRNIRADHYHAQMHTDEKRIIQQKWQTGEIHVIVATIAFGMGIDKPDVRFVIHHSIPKSLEGYYQETGRAGRDGMRSGCYLYYGYQDYKILRGMIDKGEGSQEQKDRQIQMLGNVVQFCDNQSDCRRVQVLAYFNESFKRDDCNGGCDNCNSKSVFETRDLTSYAVHALRIVKEVHRSRVTTLHCVDVFRGAKVKKVTEKNHDELPDFGWGADLNRNDAERLFKRLIAEGALAEDVVSRKRFTHTYITIGKNFKLFEKGNKRIHMEILVSPDRRPRQVHNTSQNGRLQHSVPRRHAELPLSTNISSPITRSEPRSLSRYSYNMDEAKLRKGQSSLTLHKRSDRHLDKSDIESEDEEAFEPVRGPLLGSPITTDAKMAGLDEIHRHCVDEFVHHGKQLCQKIMIGKSLRQVPFTDTMLREMAITFPRNKEEMLAIPNIEPEKVELYGKRFLDLVKSTQENYRHMMQTTDDRPMDPNHQTVVDLVSDDDLGEDKIVEEDEDFGSDFTLSEGEQSSYFNSHDSKSIAKDVEEPGRSHHQRSRSRRATKSKAPSRSWKSTRGGGRSSWRGKNAANGATGRSHSDAARGRGKSVAAVRPTTVRNVGISMMPT